MHPVYSGYDLIGRQALTYVATSISLCRSFGTYVVQCMLWTKLHVSSILEARTSTKQQPMGMEINYSIAHFTFFSKPSLYNRKVDKMQKSMIKGDNLYFSYAYLARSRLQVRFFVCPPSPATLMFFLFIHSKH